MMEAWPLIAQASCRLFPTHTVLQAGLRFTVTPLASSKFLGSPLCAAGVEEALTDFCLTLRTLSPRLLRLSSHEAYYLLKTCFVIPKLQYLIRTSSVFCSQGQAALSEQIRVILSAILNLRLDDNAWAQASLPVRWGGVGVRDIRSLAPSAFLSSLFRHLV